MKVFQYENLRFPVRPMPHPEENLIGYLIKLLTENGMAVRFGGIHELFGERLSKLPFNREAVERFANGCGVHCDWVKSMGIFENEEMNSKFVEYRGNVLEKNWLTVATPRFCRSCIKEDGRHYRYIWDIRLIRRCPKHGELLLRECPNCKKDLSWSFWSYLLREDFFCECGVNLLEESDKRHAQVNKRGQKRADSIRLFAYMLAPDMYPQWREAIPKDFAALGALTLIDLILYFGSLVDQSSAGVRERFSPTNQEFVEERVVSGVELLRRWPRSFHSRLEKLVEKNIGRRKATPESVFGRLASIETLGKLGKAEAIIRKEFERFMSGEFYHKQVLALSFPVRGTHVREPGMITSAEALAEMSLSLNSLRCLLRIAKREKVHHYLDGGQWWFSQVDIKKVIVQNRLLVGREEIEETLGFDAKSIGDLKYSFHMPLLMRSFHGHRALVVEGEAFQKLLNCARVVPRSCREYRDYQSGEFALQVFAEFGLTAAELVDAVFDGDLPAKRLTHKNLVENRIHFERLDLVHAAEFLTQRKAAEPIERSEYLGPEGI